MRNVKTPRADMLGSTHGHVEALRSRHGRPMGFSMAQPNQQKKTTMTISPYSNGAGSGIQAPQIGMQQGGSRGPGAMTAATVSREVGEVQAAMMIARSFPRDQMQSLERILNACTRPSLADAALYTYARGGQDISGPSIRLAEACAQSWGNLQFGIREIEQRDGVSIVEAFAWDIETNVRQVKVFQVSHERHTRNGAKRLTDPRDIYELVANQGARRLRSCILGVIPGDVIEAAVEQCEVTMKASADTGPETQKTLLAKFGEYGVTKEQIEKRIQRRIDAIQPAQVVALRKIYASLKDGMSKAADWFEVAAEAPQTGIAPPPGVEAGVQAVVVTEAPAEAAPAAQAPAAAPAAPAPAEEPAAAPRQRRAPARAAAPAAEAAAPEATEQPEAQPAQPAAASAAAPAAEPAPAAAPAEPGDDDDGQGEFL